MNNLSVTLLKAMNARMANVKATPYPPKLLTSIWGKALGAKKVSTRKVVLTGMPKRVIKRRAKGGKTNHALMVGNTVSPLKMPSYFPKVRSSPLPPRYSPYPRYPKVTTRAMMEPANNQSCHHLRFSLDTRKVPKVWMLSLPTTE